VDLLSYLKKRTPLIPAPCPLFCRGNLIIQVVYLNGNSACCKFSVPDFRGHGNSTASRQSLLFRSCYLSTSLKFLNPNFAEKAWSTFNQRRNVLENGKKCCLGFKDLSLSYLYVADFACQQFKLFVLVLEDCIYVCNKLKIRGKASVFFPTPVVEKL